MEIAHEEDMNKRRTTQFHADHSRHGSPRPGDVCFAGRSVSHRNAGAHRTNRCGTGSLGSGRNPFWSANDMHQPVLSEDRWPAGQKPKAGRGHIAARAAAPQRVERKPGAGKKFKNKFGAKRVIVKYRTGPENQARDSVHAANT